MARVGSWDKGGARSLHAAGLLNQLTAGIIALLSRIIIITITNPRFLVIVVLLMLPSDAFGMELGHDDGTSRITRSDLRVVVTTAAVAAVAVSAAASATLGGRTTREIRNASKKIAEQRRTSKGAQEVAEKQATSMAQSRIKVR